MYFTQRLLSPLPKIKLQAAVNRLPTKLPIAETVKLSYDLHIPSRSTLLSLIDKSEDSQQHLSKVGPIIFLPGVFGFKSYYKRDCQIIANVTHTPVYALDLRNHGDSPHALPFDYRTLTADVLQFIDDHQLTNVNIMGYSLGAKVALLALLKEPKLFSSGLVFDNAPVETHQTTPILTAIYTSLHALIAEAKIRNNDKLWREKAHDVLMKYLPDHGIAEYLLTGFSNAKPKEHVTEFDPDHCHYKFPLRLVGKDMIHQVNDWPHELVEGKQYHGPLKVVRASASDFVTKKGLNAFAEYFPSHEQVTVNSTHLLLRERNQECLRILCDFINDLKFEERFGVAKVPRVPVPQAGGNGSSKFADVLKVE